MKSSQPPVFATWILKRLGPRNEPLVGDLLEEHLHGRSGSWYWRQVVSAILIGAKRDLREHKLLALSAVLLGWLILIPWFYYTIALYRGTASWVDTRMIPGVWANGSLILRVTWWAWWIYEVPLLIAWCSGSLIIGWAIARLHWERRAGMLFACVASQLPWTLLWAWPVWSNAHVLADTAYAFPNQITAVLILLGFPFCTLVGGLWSARPEHGGA